MLTLGSALTVSPLAVVAAQQPTSVTWSAHAPPTVIPGSTVSIAVAATIAPGWHVYSLTQPAGGPSALSFAFPDGSVASIATPVRGPKPRVETQPAFDVPVELYDEGTSAFVVPITLKADVPDGPKSLRLRATWQACSKSICMLPRSQDIDVPIVVRRKR